VVALMFCGGENDFLGNFAFLCPKISNKHQDKPLQKAKKGSS